MQGNDARAEHLLRAATLMAPIVPNLSSHYGRTAATENRGFCPSCGAVNICGWNTAIRVASVKRDRKKPSKADSKSVQYTCSTCSRIQQFSIQPASRQRKIATPAPVPISTNERAKQRAKTRKMGLQDMLKKANNRSQPVLDFTDFEKLG
jgi:RNase P subunit RPR2